MKFIILLSILTFLEVSYARPEYAVRRKVNDCTACHFNPSGGGARTLFGKTQATRRFISNFKQGPYSNQDLFSLDYRAVNINSTKAKTKSPNGSGVMTSNMGLAIPVSVEEDGSEVHVIATYDLGGFAPAGARETYARFTTTSNGGLKPKSIIVGKFSIPFGLLTDEHRTYVRIMSNSSLHNFEMGTMISGNALYSLHYDLAVVEGFNQGAGMPDAGNNFGVVLNLRTNFNNSPYMLGTSGIFNKGKIDATTGDVIEYNPWALSLYSGMSLDHITNKKIRGSLVAEFVMASQFNRKAFNPAIGEYFIDAADSPTYYAEIQDKKSIGAVIKLDIDLTKHWSVFYKFDSYIPDKENMKDEFVLNTIGAKWWINSNVDVDIRFEKRQIKRSGLDNSGAPASIDNILILGRIWI